MGRHLKQGADYFPHDAHLRNDTRILAVRRKFGLEGYAVYCMLLEKCSSSESFILDVQKNISDVGNNIECELMAGEFGIDSDRLLEIIDYFFRLQLLTEVDEKRSSLPYLEEKMKPLVAQRERKRSWDQKKRKSDGKNKVSDVGNDISDVEKEAKEENPTSESTQSKGEKSKVKESTNNIKINKKQIEEQFSLFWEAYPVKKGKQIAFSAFEKVVKSRGDIIEKMLEAIASQEQERKALENARRFVAEWKYPSTWLNQACWLDEPISDINTAKNVQSRTIGAVAASEGKADLVV